jgi:signal transduction histidine kinase
MRERVLELGGVLRVQTALAHGTTIFIDLPLAEVSSG